MNTIKQYCAGILMAAALCNGSVGVVYAEEHHDNKSSDKIMARMQQSMEEMKIIKLSGDVDKDFATMMKMHHQQGIEMAQIETAEGKSPEMKKMAQKMIAAHKKEIAELDKLLSKQ